MSKELEQFALLLFILFIKQTKINEKTSIDGRLDAF
jgi:hypothetical protein